MVIDRLLYFVRFGLMFGLLGVFFLEMLEDDSSSFFVEYSEKKCGWFECLILVFFGEFYICDELVVVLYIVQEEGLIVVDILKMMEGVILVVELIVGDVMILCLQMVLLLVEVFFLELMKQVVEFGYLCFLVYGENKDDIFGILLVKDLLCGVVVDNGLVNVCELLCLVVLILEVKKFNVLLKEFCLLCNYMVIVVDEYGGVVGLVIIEDVLEQIVGEIDDEYDEVEDLFVQIVIQFDGQYVVDVLILIGDFNECFGVIFFDEDYDIIGGLVIEVVGYFLEVGDELVLDCFMFCVVCVDVCWVQVFYVIVLLLDVQDDV